MIKEKSIEPQNLESCKVLQDRRKMEKKSQIHCNHLEIQTEGNNIHLTNKD